MSPTALDGPAPRQAASPAAVVGMAVLGLAFGAVAGLHVFALLWGHAQFLTTREIEGLVTGQSLLSSPVPADRLTLWHWCQQMPLLGGAVWLKALTLLMALACAAGILVLINPGLGRRIRTADIAAWRVGVAAVASAAVLYAALLPLPEPVQRTHFPFTRAALAGGLVWLLWHRRGWLHTTEEPPSVLVILGQLVCGGLVGLTAHAFARHDRTPLDLVMVDVWLSAGYYQAAVWWQLGLYVIGRHAWGGLLAASLACFLGQPGSAFRPRLRSVLPAALLLVVTGLAAGVYRARVWRDVYQVGVPLPQLLGLEGSWQPERRVVLLAEQPDRWMPFRITLGESDVALPLTEDIADLARHRLQARQGRAAMARPLWLQVYETATWQWTPTAALEVARQQFASPSASPLFGALMVDGLLRLPPSPAVQGALDDLLDERVLAWPTPEAQAQVLDVAWRFGRLAEVGPRLLPALQERYDTLLAQPSPTAGNQVLGTLRLDGKPAAGVKLGLVRTEDWEAMRGWPRWPLPVWSQRLVIASSTTTRDGRFIFPDLFDGDYHVLVRLEPKALPRRGGLTLRGFTGPLSVSGGRRHQLGIVDLLPVKPPVAAEEVAGPSRVEARASL